MEHYYQLLQHWNRRINLTALALDGFPDAAIDRLIVEPVVASRLMPRSPGNWFDLGSGGGSPAVPLRILQPGLNLTMVESKERKGAFLREVVRQLHLERVRVLVDRIENLPDTERDSADFVTIRAVRLDDSLLKSVGQLLTGAGHILAFGLAGASQEFTTTDYVSLPDGSTASLLTRC